MPCSWASCVWDHLVHRAGDSFFLFLGHLDTAGVPPPGYATESRALVLCELAPTQNQDSSRWKKKATRRERPNENKHFVAELTATFMQETLKLNANEGWRT